MSLRRNTCVIVDIGSVAAADAAVCVDASCGALWVAALAATGVNVFGVVVANVVGGCMYAKYSFAFVAKPE